MDASTIENSTSFAIFGGSPFLQNSIDNNTTATQIASSTSLLFGNIISGPFTNTVPAPIPDIPASSTDFNNGVQLTALSAVAVPEPSTLTLAGLGAIALITRRRRA